MDFLSGNGPNPLPEKKRQEPGPLVKKFISETMQEIAEQDRENELRVSRSVADDLMAAMRLVSDNHNMIQIIQSGRCASVSELATSMGQELSNVSRTLSKMAAYGLIGFENPGTDARTKKPIWLLPKLPDREDLDWVQAYCLAMALKNRTSNSGSKTENYSAMDVVIREMVESAAAKFTPQPYRMSPAP